MKFVKILSLFLMLLLLISAFAACGGKPVETTGGNKTPTVKDDPDEIPDEVPLDLDYNGESVTFFVRTHDNKFKYELACDNLLNDPVFDAIHYRNIDVENRLGVKIKTLGENGTWEEISLWNERLSVSVLTNTGDYDGAAFYLSASSALAKDGIFYNLYELEKGANGYLDFEKPWWNQTLVEELGVFGSLFFAGGSLTLTEAQNGVCLFFNRDLFNERFPEDRDAALYQMVRDGVWTADKLAMYIAECWTDVNSNGVADDGDIVGTKSHAAGSSAGNMDAWVVAMGLDLTKTNAYGEPELALFNSHTIPAYEKARSVFGTNPGAILSMDDMKETTMQNGNMLFVNQILNFGTEMRESTVNYGVLPLPKYDEAQEDYRTCFGNIASALAVCSNLSDSRAAMVSAVLEVLSAESHKQVVPVYYGTVLQGHYSREQADAEMYDKILNSFVFSFGFAYSTQSLGNVGNIFRNLSPSFDIQNHIDSNKDSWNTKLESLLLALEEVS